MPERREGWGRSDRTSKECYSNILISRLPATDEETTPSTLLLPLAHVSARAARLPMPST